MKQPTRVESLSHLLKDIVDLVQDIETHPERHRKNGVSREGGRGRDPHRKGRRHRERNHYPDERRHRERDRYPDERRDRSRERYWDGSRGRRHVSKECLLCGSRNHQINECPHLAEVQEFVECKRVDVSEQTDKVQDHKNNVNGGLGDWDQASSVSSLVYYFSDEDRVDRGTKTNGVKTSTFNRERHCRKRTGYDYDYGYDYGDNYWSLGLEARACVAETSTRQDHQGLDDPERMDDGDDDDADPGLDQFSGASDRAEATGGTILAPQCPVVGQRDDPANIPDLPPSPIRGQCRSPTKRSLCPPMFCHRPQRRSRSLPRCERRKDRKVKPRSAQGRGSAKRLLMMRLKEIPGMVKTPGPLPGASIRRVPGPQASPTTVECENASRFRDALPLTDPFPPKPASATLSLRQPEARLTAMPRRSLKILKLVASPRSPRQRISYKQLLLKLRKSPTAVPDGKTGEDLHDARYAFSLLQSSSSSSAKKQQSGEQESYHQPQYEQEADGAGMEVSTTLGLEGPIQSPPMRSQEAWRASRILSHCDRRKSPKVKLRCVPGSKLAPGASPVEVQKELGMVQAPGQLRGAPARTVPSPPRYSTSVDATDPSRLRDALPLMEPFPPRPTPAQLSTRPPEIRMTNEHRRALTARKLMARVRRPQQRISIKNLLAKLRRSSTVSPDSSEGGDIHKAQNVFDIHQIPSSTFATELQHGDQGLHDQVEDLKGYNNKNSQSDESAHVPAQQTHAQGSGVTRKNVPTIFGGGGSIQGSATLLMGPLLAEQSVNLFTQRPSRTAYQRSVWIMIPKESMGVPSAPWFSSSEHGTSWKRTNLGITRIHQHATIAAFHAEIWQAWDHEKKRCWWKSKWKGYS